MSIIHGDCLAVMPTLEAESVDAIVCDPPYGLAFMGKAWDHGVPGPEFWAEALRVAKPGAWMVAAGGTRTFHRLACAIEDAGWEMRDCLSWLYGSGFPKGKACLKPAWEPILLARKPAKRGTHLQIDACRVGYVSDADKRLETRGVHVGGAYQHPAGDAFKRAVSPVAAAHDGGRWPANVVLSHTPECREAGTRRVKCGGGPGAGEGRTVGGIYGERGEGNHVAHRDTDGTETVPAWECAPDCPVRLLDEMSGERKSGIAVQRNGGGGKIGGNGIYGGSKPWEPRADAGYTDGGGASRFYYTAKASRSEREAGLEGMPENEQGQRYGSVQDARPHTVEGYEYPRKAIANSHPTVKPLSLMRWLCRLVTPPSGLILDPFCGSGSTGCAAVLEGFRFLGIERESEYVAIAETRIAHWAATVQPEFEAIA